MILKSKYKFFLITLLLIVLKSNSQSSTITGIVLDSNNEPIENVNIQSNQLGTISNSNGFYILKVPSNFNVTIKISHISFKSVQITLNLKPGEKYIFNPVLKKDLLLFLICIVVLIESIGNVTKSALHAEKTINGYLLKKS